METKPTEAGHMTPAAKPYQGMSRDDFNRGMAAKVKAATSNCAMIPAPCVDILKDGERRFFVENYA